MYKIIVNIDNAFWYVSSCRYGCMTLASSSDHADTYQDIDTARAECALLGLHPSSVIQAS
jgi:hypothetical protein